MTRIDAGGPSPPEQLRDLVTLLDLIRTRRTTTRPELKRYSGLGRTIVRLRMSELIEYGLVIEGKVGPSTGGRAPRLLRYHANAGYILVAELGASRISVGLVDLAGQTVASADESSDIAGGPEQTMPLVEHMLAKLMKERPASDPPLWGIGVGLPGPVEFSSGTPIAPPIMPGWDGFPIRQRLAERYEVPIWVDNEVNLMAVGELHAGVGRGVQNFVYVKNGTGIGAGLISGGRLHRGAQGCAGDIGHTVGFEASTVPCRCGHVGCLEALASGAALARDGQLAVVQRRSPRLRDFAGAGEIIDARAVERAAQQGDPVAVELLSRSARLLGESLAGVVSFFNPSLIVIGGGVGASGSQYLASVRQALYGRSLPLATRDAVIARSILGARAGLVGAGFMVLDELFHPARIGAWIGRGSPVGLPELVNL
jgi:glucokinase-like ROK family protein